MTRDLPSRRSASAWKWLSWLLGLGLLVGIIAWFRPPDFLETIQALGVSGLLAWVLFTLGAWIVGVETTVEPLNALGYRISRIAAFWATRLRAFANQLVPMTGAAVYGKALRTRIDISWSEILAIVPPQLVLSTAALSIIGIIAVLLNFDRLGAPVAIPLGSVYLAAFILAVGTLKGSPWLTRLIPDVLHRRIKSMTDALHRLARHPWLVPRLLFWFTLNWLLAGARLWILFTAAGVSPNWTELLLLIAIAEAALLFQFTPGGIGVREGALLAGAALLGIDATTAATVAVIDRLLIMAMTACFAVPAFAIMADAPENSGETRKRNEK